MNQIETYLIDELFNYNNIKDIKILNAYIKFIDNCKLKEQNIKNNEYFEIHHILPKSIFPKYKNDKNNLIKLLPEDHFKAHELLAFSLGEFMINSYFIFFKRIVKNNKIENLTESENYAKIKNEMSKHMTNVLKEQWENGTRDKLSQSKKMKEYWKDENKKIEYSKYMQNLWSNKDYKNNTIKSMKLATSKPEFKEKSSINSNRFWNNEEFENHRQQQKINHYNALQKEEYKEKHRNNQKIRMQDPELRAKCGWRKGLSRPSKTCPWCNQTHNTLGFFNTHFENCRNKKDLAKRYLRVSCILNIFNNLDNETKSQLSKYELSGKEKERRINFMFYKTPNLIGTHDFYNL